VNDESLFHAILAGVCFVACVLLVVSIVAMVTG